MKPQAMVVVVMMDVKLISYESLSFKLQLISILKTSSFNGAWMRRWLVRQIPGIVHSWR